MMLNMTNKQAVVVGGGRIAYRKMLGLLQAGARVTMISPAIRSEIEKLVTTQKVKWRNKLFEPQDLASAFIVIAATNDPQVNALVAASAGNHQLVNVADSQELSDFDVPAKLERGNLTICVATGGASPMLAKAIRDELAVLYDDTYEEYLEFLALAREKMRHSIFDQPTKLRLLHGITSQTYRQSHEIQQAFLHMMDGFTAAEKQEILL